MPDRTVAEILMQQGRDQAAATLARGQAWGGMVSQLGQIPGQVIGMSQQQQQVKQQQELNQQKIDAGQRAQKLTQTISDLTTQAMNPDGTLNRDILTKGMSLRGISPADQANQIDALDGMEASAQKFADAHDDARAELAAGVKRQVQAGATPEDALAFAITIAKHRQHRIVTDEDIKDITDGVANGAGIMPMMDHIMSLSKKFAPKYEKVGAGEKIVDVTRTSPTTGEAPVVATGTPKPLTTDQIALDAATLGTPQETPTAKQSDAAMKRLKPGAQPRAPTTSEIALKAAQGDKNAIAAMKLLKPEHAATDPQSPQTQERLEQEYRGVLQREMSSRSGGLGLEDQKVNQANHLLALLDQFEGKNMPAQMQAELALGLARLTSPSGQVGIQLEQEFNQRTAASGLSKAVAWLTGDPTLVNATPEKMREMFRDSITRQGEVAVDNRDAYFKAMRAMAPTDLSESRRTQLEQGMGLNPLRSGRKGASSVPDLTGLAPGHGRTFNSGPFKGQTWTIGTDGQPKRVN